MDKLRKEAIKALFGKGISPKSEHVQILMGNLILSDEERDELFDEDQKALNNLEVYAADASLYIADLDGISIQHKILLQRLAGLPEDAEPESAKPVPIPDGVPYKKPNPPEKKKDSKKGKSTTKPDKPHDSPPAPQPEKTEEKKPDEKPTSKPDDLSPKPGDSPPASVPIPQPDPVPKGDARQIALALVFHREKKQFTSADLKAIGSRSKPERGDELILNKQTFQRLKLFDLDPEGMIDGMDPDTLPGFTETEIAQYRSVLQTLLSLREEETPVASPPIQKPRVVLNLDAIPLWVRELNRTEYWILARGKIEKAFADSRSPDQETKDRGADLLQRWKNRMRSHRDGESGQKLVHFGERMLKCIRELEAGADRASVAYKKLYVNF